MLLLFDRLTRISQFAMQKTDELKGICKTRQQLRKQLRKEQLSEVFQSKRKELRLHNEQQERNMFNELYPRVTSHNYEEHRNLLKCFSSNENYNFLLLPLAGLAFDYLLLSPHDEDSWGIVEELTQFDEFDVPLTEDFAALLLDNMRLRIITVLTIIDNLARISRYKELLRDQLLDSNFLLIMDRELAELHEEETREHVMVLLASIYSMFVSTHPALALEISCQIVVRLASFCTAEDCLMPVLSAFEQVNRSFKESHQMAQLLRSSFRSCIAREYLNYEIQFMSLFIYSLRSGALLTDDEVSLLLRSLSSPIPNCKQKTLTCLRMMLSRKTNANVLGSAQLTLKLIQIFINESARNLRYDCLSVLFLQLRVQVEQLGSQCVEDAQEKLVMYQQDLVHLLSVCFGEEDASLVLSALDIASFLVQYADSCLEDQLKQALQCNLQAGIGCWLSLLTHSPNADISQGSTTLLSQLQRLTSQ